MERVGIIILNWNGLHDTLECVNSVLNNSYRDLLDIIVIDNGSNNNEGEKIRKLYGEEIYFIQNQINKGFTGGCNQGIKLATKVCCKYWMLLNNDAILVDGVIEKLLSEFVKDKSIGVVGPLITYYGSDTIWNNGGAISILSGSFRSIDKGKKINNLSAYESFEVDYVCGCAFLVKSEVSDSIGLLDENYFAYGEEADFCIRAKYRGRKVYQVPSVFLPHKVSASTGPRGGKYFGSFKSYLIAKNSIYYGIKHLKGLSKLRFLLMQYTLKMIYNIVFNINTIESLKSYLKGLYGFSYSKDGYE